MVNKWLTVEVIRATWPTGVVPIGTTDPDHEGWNKGWNQIHPVDRETWEATDQGFNEANDYMRAVYRDADEGDKVRIILHTLDDSTADLPVKREMIRLRTVAKN